MSCFSEIEYFLGIFDTGQIFRSLEGVTSSGEVLEGIAVFRVRNEGPVGIGNTFLELVPELEATQFGAISGGAVSINVTLSLVSEMEKKYAGTVLRLKG
jgi:hypothetical protein